MEDQGKHSLQGPHWQPRIADTLPELTPLRLVVDGGEAAVVIDRSDMVAGRHSEADVPLQLPDVSRRHCRFIWTEGHWHVTDLGSLNGVWVNDQRVQEACLEEGDRLRIGGFGFVVRLNAAPMTMTTMTADKPSLFSLLRLLPGRGEPARRLAS